MVELSLGLSLDNIFASLADPTRRDILRQVAIKELSVSDIAKAYNLTFAAISKHLKVLERAKLITKRKEGREQIVQLAPSTMKDATEYLRTYEKLWNDRFDALDAYLKTLPK
ncbi:MAG: ArsR family transcriptional regulator [Candidatus Peribacteria bacterium]|nr:ArsR family transcriptional regulator [Candidatus Peribacteria bacterium]